MKPRGQVWKERIRIGLIGFAIFAGLIEGCAGRNRREETGGASPASLSRLPTMGSDLKVTPASVSMSRAGTDLGNGWQGKMAKMVDDTVGQVAAPGFATIR